MEEEKITFIKWLYDYSNVILSILSGFIGALTGHLLTKSLSREERKWRINDPIIGLRVEAQKNLLKIAQDMLLVKKNIINGEIKEFVYFFESMESYTKWNNDFIGFASENLLWFSEEIKTCILDINIYIGDIRDLVISNNHIQKGEFTYLLILGNFLVNDFIKIGKTLIKLIGDYFNSDLLNFSVSKDLDVLMEDIQESDYREKMFGGLEFYKQRSKLDRLLK